MIYAIEDAVFDTRLEFQDWRFSAAAVGLMRYFHHFDIPYEQGNTYLTYRRQDVVGEEAQKNYLLFVEYFFKDAMHHLVIEEFLRQPQLTPNEEKLFNDKLKGNTILKKIFGKMTYAPDQKDIIRQLIEENRLEIIKETYRNGKSLYANYANTNSLFTDKGEVCRLVGYYMDLPKKGKSTAYHWDYSTFVYADEPELDFVPFGFTKTYEGFFVNNNFSAKQLLRANDALKDHEQYDKSARRGLLMSAQHSANFVDYDVEIITKHREKAYFETLYIRPEAIKILRDIGNRYVFMTYPCPLKNGEYLDLEKEVTFSILNHLHLDRLIEILLKDPGSHDYTLDQLILINHLIYANNLTNGGDQMTRGIDKARASAKQIQQSFYRKNLYTYQKSTGKYVSNKLNSYQQKLLSALTFKDSDRFYNVLVQLSSYAEIELPFIYELLEDFEENKNIAYAFVHDLGKEFKPQEDKKNDQE